MDISELRNPYDYGNAVRDPDLFAGRVQELDELEYVLDQAGPDMPLQYVAVHGVRASGKTSLINMAALRATELGHLTVRIDLVPGDANPVGFFTKLYEELIAASSAVADLAPGSQNRVTPRLVRRVIAGKATDDDLPLEVPENLAQAADGGQLSELALRTDLEYLAKTVGRPVVVFIDEAQLIADNKDVLSVLRALGARLRGYTFVLAGTPDLLRRVHEVFGQLLRQFVFVKLERFTEIGEVVTCMSQPLASIGLDPEVYIYEPVDLATDLFSVTDGNPYEIQFYCHAMFARWQTGASLRIGLSPEVFDDAWVALGAGRDVDQRPLVKAVQSMSPTQLRALNVLCSSMGRAELSEIRFAHTIAGQSAMPHDELDRHLDTFVESGIVERDGGTLRLTGDLADHIYARLWTMRRLDSPHHHAELINNLDFPHLLSRNLLYFLCSSVDDPSAKLLRTCCYAMSPENLHAGVDEIDTLKPGANPNHTVPYLLEAILDSGIPAALDITAVHCSFGPHCVTRWLCTSDAEDFDLSAVPAFVEAAETAKALGGELRAERTRQPLKPWPRIVNWLVDNATAKMRPDLAAVLVLASYARYVAGDPSAAFELLETSFRFESSWKAANNLSYMSSNSGDYGRARKWAGSAVELAANHRERTLSEYNLGVALLAGGELAEGRRQLTATAEAMSRVPDLAHEISYLLIPRLGDKVELHEETDVDLKNAVSAAAELAEVAEKYFRLQGS